MLFFKTIKSSYKLSKECGYTYLKRINFREDLFSRGQKKYNSRILIFANQSFLDISRINLF